MVSVRVLCEVAALSAGILGGFILYKGPSQPADRVYALAQNGRTDDAINAQTTQISSHPKDYMGYMRRGLLLEQAGRHEEALSDFTEALRRSPPVMTADELGDRINNLALPETHKFNMARELHSERAMALEALGRPDDALADLDATVALNPKDMMALHQRAIIRTYVGRISDAVTDFNTILDHRPNVDAVVGRANAKYLGGDYAGAADDFSTAMRASGDKGRYAVSLKSQLRGRLAIPLKQFEDLPKSHPAWVGIDALLSDYTPSQMAASLSAGMAKDKSLACDGMVFLGEWLVIKTDGQAAPAIFRDALDMCRPGTMPHAVAMLELRRLAAQANTTPATPETPATVPAIMHKTPAAGSFPGI